MKQRESEQYELMIGGSGGQGVLLIGRLLAKAATSVFRHVSFFPNYGAQMRAGPSECTIILSKEEISSPALLQSKVVVAMDQVYLDKFEKRIHPDGILLADNSLRSFKFERSDIKVYYLPATQKAIEYDSLQSANFVFLGAYIGLTKAVPLEAVDEAIVERFEGGKGEALIPINKALLREGVNLAIFAVRDDQRKSSHR